MNALSREVLKEIRFGILITELDRKRRRIRRSGCPGMKRVLGWSRFVFGCHRSRLTQTEEREREKETIRKVPSSKIYQNILNRTYVCMGMHEHRTCKSNCIIGSAQSNPTNTQVCNKVNTHLRMHETLL